MHVSHSFYRNPEVPLNGTTPSNPWKAPGAAFTASSINLRRTNFRLISADWFLVWTPMAIGTYNAVRIGVKKDFLPENYATEVQIASISRNSGNSPVVDSVNLTDRLNSILDELEDSGLSHYQLIMRTAGDTQSKIWRSELDFVWDI